MDILAVATPSSKAATLLLKAITSESSQQSSLDEMNSFVLPNRSA